MIAFPFSSLLHSTKFDGERLLRVTFQADHVSLLYVSLSYTSRLRTNLRRFSHVKLTGSHVTLFTVFLRGYWQFDTLLNYILLILHVVDTRAETNTCTIRLFDRFDSIRMLLQLFEYSFGVF